MVDRLGDEVVGDLLGLAEQRDRLRVDRLRVAGLVQPLAQPVEFGPQPGPFGVPGLDLVGQRAEEPAYLRLVDATAAPRSGAARPPGPP